VSIEWRVPSGFPIEDENVSVVCLGSFNPAIFQPKWLRQESLATEAQQLQAENDPQFAVTRDVAIVSVGESKLQVQAERMQVMGPATSMQQVHDLAHGILHKLLHSPVKAIGMNRHTHVRAPDLDAWHKVGHRLVPKPIWLDFMEDPGMQSVSVKGVRSSTAAKGGSLTVTVAPSAVVTPGIYITVNEHYQIQDESAENALLRLEEWASIQAHARHMAVELINKCLI
jgi:hypothetical protein